MTYAEKIEKIKDTAYHFCAWGFIYPAGVQREHSEEYGTHMIVAPRADKSLLCDIYRLFGMFANVEPNDSKSVLIVFNTKNPYSHE